jgi:hypothetical protein
VNLFVMGLVLILTVSLGITLGVVSGYLIISGILNAFARKPVAANAAPALVHSVAGD